MVITKLNKDFFIAMCVCGQRHTFNFDVGGVNTKTAPFSLIAGESIVYRFDNDGGNAGTTETITFAAGDFPDFNNISADELVVKLNSVLVAGKAINDFGTVLVESKTSGATSCVEVLDGYAAEDLGYNVRGDQFNHYCCGRVCLGYAPDLNRHFPNAVLVRRCNSCGSQATIHRNMTDYTNNPQAANNIDQRKAVNSLCNLLKSNGYVDCDMKDYYAAEKINAAECFIDFPLTTPELILHTEEEIQGYIARKKSAQ